MKLHFTFKHMSSSSALVEYTADKLSRLEKFEMKPSQIQCEFWVDRHECGCDLVLRSANGQMKASGVSGEIHQAVEQAIDKLERQLQKRKSKVQHHRRPEFSQDGQLARTNESLEVEHAKLLKKRTSREAS